MMVRSVAKALGLEVLILIVVEERIGLLVAQLVGGRLPVLILIVVEERIGCWGLVAFARMKGRS